ncbi:MAG: gliding motility-associated C-terminal domain-containing protein [Bacteroidia bacterium]
MKTFFKSKFILLLLVLQSCSLFATHIVGGSITVKSIGSNNFIVTLTFYRDCSPGTAPFDDSVTLGVYDKITNVAALEYTLPKISSTVLALGDSCFTPAGLCVEEGIYADTLHLLNNPDGYYLSWQRCCRNNIIQNIVSPGSAGMVFYAEIPDPALGDSSPVFGSYPNAYMCVSQPNTQSFAANDSNGDSLAYFLITPLNGNASSISPIPAPSPGPYSNINWLAPYSAADMIGGVPVMAIDVHTGLLTAKPSAIGVYVFAVVVKEYRAGVQIGEVRRDIQYQVISCNTNAPPTFSQPTIASYTIVAGDSLCIPVIASDPNNDWVGLTASSELLSGSSLEPPTAFASDSAMGNVSSQLCLASTCANIRDEPYHVTFYVRDHSCYGSNTVLNQVDITILSPLDGKLNSLIPNVFTPNGDGLNDFFKVNADHINSCFDSFKINIYGIWGELIYQSTDFHFEWDGKNKGKAMSDGVYFYIIEGKFKNQDFKYNGSVQLLR